MNNNFTTLEASYRIVTPMFCSGADQKTAELRLASFKGALRFWWRSIMWGKVKDVADLQNQEAQLFGSSDQKIGQSKVRMRLTKVAIIDPATSAQWAQQKGIQYLGYGVMNFKGELSRPMIPGGTFTVQLRLGPGLSQQQIEQVQNALILLGSIGGLGSKSRKGLGSLTLTILTKDQAPIELSIDPAVRIRSVIGTLSSEQSEWTAWSEGSRALVVTNGGGQPVDLLDKLGREQVHFRSWGRNGKVLGNNREGNFKEDHDLSKGQSIAIKHPKRIAFGLPHNYQTGGVQPADHDRRISPLLLHIHQTSKMETPIGVIVFLPSLFLPNGEQIKAFGKQVDLDRSDGFWSPIHAFLDRLIANGQKPDNRPGYADFPEDSTWWIMQTDLTAEEVHLG